MAQVQSKSTKGPAPRLFDLDNFRTYLTALVILHHTAIPYGGLGSWTYTSSYHTPNSSPALIAFNLLNQSYFMGAFFFLSGYFSSKTLQRKSPSSFLLTKFYKLGLPTLALTLFGGPAQQAILRLHEHQPLTWSLLSNHFKSLRGVKGSVWYLALVLVFDTLYIVFPNFITYVSHFSLPQTLILDITTSFLIRLVYPVGTIFIPLNLQPAFLPQYIASYLLGASRIPPSPPPLSPTSFKTLLACSVLSATTSLSLLHFYPTSYTIHSFTGGPNLLALNYAIWNESTGYLLGSGIRYAFHHCELLNRHWGNVGKYSYAAFLAHGIVVVGLQAGFDEWRGGGVLKTLVLGTMGVVGSWAVGWGVVRVPGMRGILL